MKYTLSDLTAADVNLISAALGKLPFEQVFNLVVRLRDQVAAQEAAARAPPVDGADPASAPTVN